MWYASEDSTKGYVSKIINQIEEYGGDNWI
jgi:hypothetical protein